MWSVAMLALRSMAVSRTGGLGFRRNLGILSIAARGEILVALAAALFTALAKRVTRWAIDATFAVAVAAVFDRWIGS
jgi:hypothetical protein